VVLGCSSKKGYTSNVDLLDSGSKGAVGLAGLENEGVEVADDEGDWGDGVGSEVGKIGGDVPGQDTCLSARSTHDLRVDTPPWTAG
jgi:hypothetical protein